MKLLITSFILVLVFFGIINPARMAMYYDSCMQVFIQRRKHARLKGHIMDRTKITDVKDQESLDDYVKSIIKEEEDRS